MVGYELGKDFYRQMLPRVRIRLFPRLLRCRNSYQGNRGC